MSNTIPETGAAGIIVELSKSQITVTHSQDKTELLSGPVVYGAWDRIWDAINREIEMGNKSVSLDLTLAEWREVVGWLGNGNSTAQELASKIEMYLENK